jgi:hypothetical protein
MTSRIAGAAVVLWAVVGCGPAVTGNGVIQTETRTAGAFSAVDVGSGIEADVTLGTDTTVVLEADENVLPLVTSEVKDGKLVLGLKPAWMVSVRKPIRAHLVTPKLVTADASGGAKVDGTASEAPDFKAAASGGARITLCGVKAERVSVASSGGATVSLCGTTGDLQVAASGGAIVFTDGLTAGSVHLDGSGGAMGKVFAANAVTGDLSGGASFTVLGNPGNRQVSLSGGATVKY